MATNAPCSMAYSLFFQRPWRRKITTKKNHFIIISIIIDNFFFIVSVDAPNDQRQAGEGMDLVSSVQFFARLVVRFAVVIEELVLGRLRSM